MHDAGHGSEGVVIFCKMFGEVGCVWVVSIGCLMLFITGGEPSATERTSDRPAEGSPKNPNTNR